MGNKRLKDYRVIKLGITQMAMAEKMGVSPVVYRQVEAGFRRGTMAFWDKFQETFNIPDSKMRAFEKGRE